MNKTLSTFCLMLTSVSALFAQTKIKDGSVAGSSSVPNSNAVLDVESSSKGLLMPRLALSAINNPSPLSAHIAGMMVYNTATTGTAPNNVTPGFYYNDGTKWVPMVVPQSNDWTLTGNPNATSTSILGATSNQPLHVYAGQSERMTIDTSGNIGVATTLPGSKMTVNGSFAGTYKIVTASGAIGANDFYIAYNGAAAGTLTLPASTIAAPAAGNFLGRMYHIKNTGTMPLTVAANGSELIDNQTGAGLANISISPGYYALIISKGTTGANTNWEVAIVGNATEATKPQVLTVEILTKDTLNRGSAGTTTNMPNDTSKVNTIVGASYDQNTNLVTLPAGTYMISFIIDAGYSPGGTDVADSTTTSDHQKPNTSFFYDFPSGASGISRVHYNTLSNFGYISNFGMSMQYMSTITATRTLKFAVGWGQGGNVNTGKAYLFNGTQLIIQKLL